MKTDNEVFKNIIDKINSLDAPGIDSVQKILQKNPLINGAVPKKSIVLDAFNNFLASSELVLTSFKIKEIRMLLQMKKTRTISGVTPVTVLTKPYPCPGKCIFCPSDIRMPKSYLSSEPGAQRARSNRFDPYFQTYNRLCAYASIGHPTDKIELIILGGTWSVYPKDYQIWFVKRCFDAMNEFNSDSFEIKIPDTKMPYEDKSFPENIKSINYNMELSKGKNNVKEEVSSWSELFSSHKINESALTRCVGLVVETRPEYITDTEMIHIRKLGATKIQIGIQSLDNDVLKLNKRGHKVEDTKRAFQLLRKYGFKIHGHWMPNLYGSSVEKDIKDYKKLFTSDFCPDELKIYPCSLIKSAELMDYYKDGLWEPYTNEELLEVLVGVFKNTPRYCRLTRVIRDIPSQEIVVGNKKTNFRQVVEKELVIRGIRPVEIRSREVRGEKINPKELEISILEYKTNVSKEIFIEYITSKGVLAGFLRLSFFDDSTSSMVREIHVYGQSLQLGTKENGKPQHIGLGKNLLEKAKEISKQNNYSSMRVISSVGTREYYRKRGFVEDGLYQKIDF